MSTQPSTSDEATLRAFRRYAHDLWEAMSSSNDSELPRLHDYPLPAPRSSTRERVES